MKKYLPLILLLFTFLLAACQPSKVGGACTYIDLIEVANVTEIQSSFALLANEYNQYEVKLDLFTSPPKVGEGYKVAFSKISQGTCTPINIKSVELLSQQ